MKKKKKDALGRRLWWEPSDTVYPIRLEDYDYLILEQYLRYRYLRWDILARLLPPRSAATLRRRLRLMVDARLLFLPDGQFANKNANYSRNYHSITEAGIKTYLERFPRPYEVTQLDGRTNFAHDAVGVCNTIASIEGGAKAAGYTLVTWEEVLERIPDATPDTFKFTAYVDGREVKFRPDGFFGLLKDNQRKFFVLEHERGNPNTRKASSDRSAWEKKCLAYQDFMSREVYVQQLNISNLRLLTTTTNEPKAQHISELTFQMQAQSNRFAFNHVPPLGAPSSPEYVYPDLFNEQLWYRPGLPSATLRDFV